MVDIILVFISSLVNVFFLILSSRMGRDNKWIQQMFVSFGISAAQFIFVLVVARSDNPYMVLISSSIGGSIGVGLSHHFYIYLSSRGKRHDNCNQKSS